MECSNKPFTLNKPCDYCGKSIEKIDFENNMLIVVFHKGHVLYFDKKECLDQYPLNELTTKTIIKLGELID